MRRSPFFVILLVSVFLVFSIPQTLASSSTFTFNFARNITTFSPNIQNVTNTYGFTIDIRIYVETVDNITLLKKFALTANGTTFINITDGAIIQTENTFYGLLPTETLMYDASATPIPTINNGNTAKITYITEISEAIPPYIPPIIGLPTPTPAPTPAPMSSESISHLTMIFAVGIVALVIAFLLLYGRHK